MEKSETRGQNETKISLCEGNSACVTFTGNGKGELMCWNSIPPSSHREGPAFHCQAGIMWIIWSLFSTRCLRDQDFLCTPAVNKARKREGNSQSSKSPSQPGHCVQYLLISHHQSLAPLHLLLPPTSPCDSTQDSPGGQRQKRELGNTPSYLPTIHMK